MSFNIMMVNGRFTTIINNKSYVVATDHPNYDTLLQALKDGDADTFLDNYTIAKKVDNHYSGTDVVVKDGQVLYKGKVVHNVITERIIDFAENDLPTEGMINFLKNLMDNPSRRAVTELYGFLEHRNLPITPDGHFLAYKAVRDNYLDKYSGKFDNSVGAVLEMPRNEVDDEASRTCSHGFHVGALEYAGPGGWYHRHADKVMIVKINPRDAVSVPADHNAQKLRVCRYEVVGEYEKPLDDTLDTTTGMPEKEADASADGVFEAPYDKYLTDDPEVFEGLGHVREEYSHTRRYHDGWSFRSRNVRTKRRTLNVSNYDIMVCYNTDDTVRWVTVKDNNLAPDLWGQGDGKTVEFVRFTDAY